MVLTFYLYFSSLFHSCLVLILLLCMFLTAMLSFAFVHG